MRNFKRSADETYIVLWYNIYSVTSLRNKTLNEGVLEADNHYENPVIIHRSFIADTAPSGACVFLGRASFPRKTRSTTRCCDECVRCKLRLLNVEYKDSESSVSAKRNGCVQMTLICLILRCKACLHKLHWHYFSEVLPHLMIARDTRIRIQTYHSECFDVCLLQRNLHGLRQKKAEECTESFS